MSTIRKNIIVMTPAAQVWEVLGEPEQWSRLNPNVTNYVYQLCEGGGYSGEWVYKLGRLKLFAKIRTHHYNPNRRLVVETCGQMESKWTWWLESDNRWTHLALVVDYTAKWSGIGTILHQTILENEHNQALDIYLGNIKQKTEQLNH